jgi:DedD protein
MAIRSDSSDPAVDELRRRARRRLVGAIVLALAAAVLLPLLLENEPKPLGDDVSIQIPPIDSGKFVNPLSPTKDQDPKAKGSVAVPSPAAPALPTPPATTVSGGEIGQGASPAASGPPAQSTAPAASETKPDDAPAAKPDAKPAPAQSGQGAPEAKAKSIAQADAARSGAAFVVQVAAFSDRYGARSLVAKLKRDGFPSYAEEVETPKGTMHRVRVGPYPSRDAAATALAKLKAAGFSGMVAHVG